MNELIEEKLKEFDKKAAFGYLGKESMTAGCFECGESIYRENIKSFLSSTITSAFKAGKKQARADMKAELLEKMKPIQERFRCGRCDSGVSNLSHTMSCTTIAEIRKIIEEL
jgi:hypothetical protein